MIENKERFLKSNGDALKLLAEKLREASKIDGIEDIVELKARQKAVKMVKGWIDGIWTEINVEELDGLIEDDPIFKMNKTELVRLSGTA